MNLPDCVKDKSGEDSVEECNKLIEMYKGIIEKVYIYVICKSDDFDNPRCTCESLSIKVITWKY